MLQDATFWVAVAFVVFVGLAYKKVAAILGTTLDARSARIRNELEEAQRLREDAQAVLAECQKRQIEAEDEAEKILAYAREEAERVRVRADEEVQIAVKRRETQAIDRIAQAEAQAVPTSAIWPPIWPLRPAGGCSWSVWPRASRIR